MFQARTVGLLSLVAAMAACGGGENDRQIAVPINYLVKYQGTWWQGCSSPILFSPGTWGPASIREKLVVSAPNASGAVTLDLVEEFFDSTLACWDQTSTPYATIRTTQLTTATYAGQQAYPVAVGTAPFDVLSQTRPATAVQAVGTGISSVVVSGTPVWRITFSNGSSIDRTQQAPALAGAPLPLLRVTVNAGTTSQFYTLSVGGTDRSYFQR